MSATTRSGRRPVLRYALLGAAVSAGWLTVSLISGAQSASADDHDGDGLLGAVGSLLGGVSQTDAVGDAVGEVVHTAVAPVDAVVEAVTPSPAAVPAPAAPAPAPVPAAPAPAPVPAPPATPAPQPSPVTATDPASSHGVATRLVDGTTGIANGAIDGVDRTAMQLVGEVADTLTELASSRLVGSVTDPVVEGVDGLLGTLPATGDLLGDDLLGTILKPVTGAVDDALGEVVGSVGSLPVGGVLPTVPGAPPIPGPGSGTNAPGAGGYRLLAAPRGVVDAATAADASTQPTITRLGDRGDRAAASASNRVAAAPSSTPAVADDPAPSSAPGTPASAPAGTGTAGATGSGAGATGAASDAIFDADALSASAALVLNAIDDDLPSSPVFATDSTPD